MSTVRLLRSPAEVKARRAMLLAGPHMTALVRYATDLRASRPGEEIPDFDPISGGKDAEILFLLEKPGPATSRKGGGSGFISLDNDDPTAETVSGFYRDIGLDRRRTLHWNIVPGWNGTRKVTRDELKHGVEALSDLIDLLPKLRLVIFVGNRARRAEKLLRKLRPELRFAHSAHPSPIVRASNRAMWDAIPRQWAAAMAGRLDERAGQ
jgi:hypothetical protein